MHCRREVFGYRVQQTLNTEASGNKCHATKLESVQPSSDFEVGPDEAAACCSPRYTLINTKALQPLVTYSLKSVVKNIDVSTWPNSNVAWLIGLALCA